eukprot:999759-Pleurochrysis_carterae.AAC.1
MRWMSSGAIARELLEAEAEATVWQFDGHLSASFHTVCAQVHSAAANAATSCLAEIGQIVHVNLASYTSMLRSFGHFLHGRLSELRSSQNRLEKGLRKLRQTRSGLEKYNQDLAKLEGELRVTSVEVARAASKFDRERAEAEERRASVQSEDALAVEKEKECAAIRESAEADLAQVRTSAAQPPFS